MVLPWLDEPVMLHSSRADTCKLTPAQCEYRSGYWRYWYQADHVYGHATICFMCAVIGVFTVVNILSRVAQYKKNGAENQSSVSRRVHAICRLMAYKSWHVRGLGWYSPTLGIMILGVCGVVFFFGLTFGPQPYYWPNTETVSYGGSPPLGTRTGWMSLALLPFVMLTASKANYISLLTGISHERLQVFHRWTSWTMFVLALIHTFPFLVVHIQQKYDMEEEWRTSVVYWTGVAALIPQAWLNIMSIGPIRNQYYEFFKTTHFIVVVAFIFFLFIHCDFRLTSWDYFIAALSLYSASLLYSFISSSIRSLHTHARFLILPDSTIRVSIPTKTSWAPAQHVFIRFWLPGLHAYTSHPFTVASIPSTSSAKNEMVFYIAPRAGSTARLTSLVAGRRNTMPVSIDGPYGDAGIVEKLQGCGSVLLVAGGSGAAFLFPVLEALLQTATAENERNIKIVIAVPYTNTATWIAEAIGEILAGKHATANANQQVEVRIHVTKAQTKMSAAVGDFNLQQSKSITNCSDGSEDECELVSYPSQAATMKGLEASISSQRSASPTAKIEHGKGRPDLKNAVLAQRAANGVGTLGVVGCGPAAMMLDLRDVCAEVQKDIVRGADVASGAGGGGVWLHTEAFSW